MAFRALRRSKLLQSYFESEWPCPANSRKISLNWHFDIYNLARFIPINIARVISVTLTATKISFPMTR
jgi:hypothetical protein